MSSMAATKNWAEVPRELLARVIQRLTITSIHSFQMVCHSWNSAVQEEAALSLLTPAPSPPWLTIPQQQQAFSPDSEDENNNDDDKKKKLACFFNPTYQKVYSFEEEEAKKRWFIPPRKEALCVGSCHGWLAFIDVRCIIYLSNPFKQPNNDKESSIIELPSIETFPCIRGVEENSSPSCINFTYWNALHKTTYTAPSNKTYTFFITKLVMSSAPSPSGEEFTVMVIYDELFQLAFCKSGDTSWTALNGALDCYIDLYYSSNDQRFFACDQTGSFEIWDLRDSSTPKSACFMLPLLPRFPPSTSIDEQRWRRQCTEKMYLVQLCGDLLLVDRYIAKEVTEDGQIFIPNDNNSGDSSSSSSSDEEYEYDANALSYNYPYKTYCFDVYKLDWVEKRWIQIKFLGSNGDGVIFLGLNNALTFSAAGFQELKGNSIYFTDDYNDGILQAGQSYGGHDLGIFSLEDNSIHSCYYPGDLKKISPPPIWISPNPW